MSRAKSPCVVAFRAVMAFRRGCAGRLLVAEEASRAFSEAARNALEGDGAIAGAMSAVRGAGVAERVHGIGSPFVRSHCPSVPSFPAVISSKRHPALKGRAKKSGKPLRGRGRGGRAPMSTIMQGIMTACVKGEKSSHLVVRTYIPHREDNTHPASPTGSAPFPVREGLSEGARGCLSPESPSLTGRGSEPQRAGWAPRRRRAGLVARNRALTRHRASVTIRGVHEEASPPDWKSGAPLLEQLSTCVDIGNARLPDWIFFPLRA